MFDWVIQIMDAGIIAGHIFGGIIALLIAVVVSRREFDRQTRQKRNNWYREVHNLCLRAQGMREVNQRTLSGKQIAEQAKQYQAINNYLQELLPNAPIEEVDIHLFNSLQNIELSCLRYVNEAESSDTSKVFLQNHHKTINTFCLIVQYIIEEKKDPDIEFLENLNDDEYEQAKEDYQDWVDGVLYEDDMSEDLREFFGLEPDNSQ